MPNRTASRTLACYYQAITANDQFSLLCRDVAADGSYAAMHTRRPPDAGGGPASR
jgi:hypothetical protein